MSRDESISAIRKSMEPLLAGTLLKSLLEEHPQFVSEFIAEFERRYDELVAEGTKIGYKIVSERLQDFHITTIGRAAWGYRAIVFDILRRPEVRVKYRGLKKMAVRFAYFMVTCNAALSSARFAKLLDPESESSKSDDVDTSVILFSDFLKETGFDVKPIRKYFNIVEAGLKKSFNDLQLDRQTQARMLAFLGKLASHFR